MSRSRTVHRCTECGAVATRWFGRCPACGEWNCLVEEAEESLGPSKRPASIGPAAPIPLLNVDPSGAMAWPTGIGELDRVLGGGLVPGSVTLLGGEPGIGKSTLLLQALVALAGADNQCLLISAEESAQQVRMRVDRLGELTGHLWILSDTELPVALAAIKTVKPDYLVVDSIQTVFDPDLESAPGSVAQVRGCAHRLVQEAKQRGMATILVGHVTKEGSPAGPACSGIWSTPCSPSTASVTTPSACCGPSSAGSGPPASWVCSRWVTAGWWVWPTPAASSWATAGWARPGRSSCRPWPATGRCWSSCRRW